MAFFRKHNHIMSVTRIFSVWMVWMVFTWTVVHVEMQYHCKFFGQFHCESINSSKHALWSEHITQIYENKSKNRTHVPRLNCMLRTEIRILCINLGFLLAFTFASHNCTVSYFISFVVTKHKYKPHFQMVCLAFRDKTKKKKK